MEVVQENTLLWKQGCSMVATVGKKKRKELKDMGVGIGSRVDIVLRFDKDNNKDLI